MSDPHDDQSIVIFGQDITKIPCFRNSFLYGVSGGIGLGLAYFLFTSRVRGATHFGLASYAVITMSYWVQCRYQYSKSKFEMQRMQELMKHHNVLEGSQQEREIDANIILTPVDV